MTRLKPVESILVGALALGFLGLCILIVYSVIVVANEPVEGLRTPEPGSPLTASPTAGTLILPTDSAAPLPSPTLALQPEQIPTPIPSFNDSPPPVGKIVFACYIQQIEG